MKMLFTVLILLSLAREKQNEVVVKELLLKYIDGYTSEED